MSFVRGQRFHLDLDSDADDDITNNTPPSRVPVSFVRDVQERQTSTAPPPAPSLRSDGAHHPTGFPAHKKRTPRTSAFGQRSSQARPADAAAAKSKDLEVNQQSRTGPDLYVATDGQDGRDGTPSPETLERQSIDAENRRRIAEMSPAQIERERQELMSALSPGLIERLLKRATIDDGGQDAGTWHRKVQGREKGGEKGEGTTAPAQPHRHVAGGGEGDEDDGEHEASRVRLENVKTTTVTIEQSPSGAPPLDPASNTFLTDLHATYFPTHDPNPASLSWLSPLPPTDPLTAYLAPAPSHPESSSTTTAASDPSSSESAHESIPPNALRFSLTGSFLPPGLASRIPTSQGLHHHAAAPAAAGYTVSELARLARSAVPAQRCMAYRTLAGLLEAMHGGEFDKGNAAAAAHGKVRGPDQRDAEVGGNTSLAAAVWHMLDQERVGDILRWEGEPEPDADVQSRGEVDTRTVMQQTDSNEGRIESASNGNAVDSHRDLHRPKHASARAYASDALRAFKQADEARKRTLQQPRRAV